MEHQQTPTRPQRLPWVLQLHLLGRCSHSSWHPLQPWVAGSPLAASLRSKRWAACPARNCGTQGPDGIFGDRMSQGSPSLLLQKMFYDSIVCKFEVFYFPKLFINLHLAWKKPAVLPAVLRRLPASISRSTEFSESSSSKPATRSYKEDRAWKKMVLSETT